MTIFILINFLVNIAILPYFKFFGIGANTAIGLIVVVALIRGRFYGGFLGIIIGILHDIIFSQAIGINAFIYFFIGYTVGSIGNVLSRDNMANPFLFTMLSTIFYNIVYSGFMYFLNFNLSGIYIWKRVFSIEILYNGILAIIIYRLYLRVFKPRVARYKRIAR